MVKSLGALALGLVFAASAVEATDLRRGSIIPRSGSIVPRVGPIVPHGPNIVPNPPPEDLNGKHDGRGKPGHGHLGHGHHHGFRPGVVFVTPPLVYAPVRECVSPGYWAYQWIPTQYTTTTWVPGGWSADGSWIEGHYAYHSHTSGYYQPYWVPGQSYTC
jgi:hypothetical protein